MVWVLQFSKSPRALLRACGLDFSHNDCDRASAVLVASGQWHQNWMPRDGVESLRGPCKRWHKAAICVRVAECPGDYALNPLFVRRG